MKTKAQTTYVLLERGVEDKGLLNEIMEVFAALKISPYTFEAHKKYPYLTELRQGLEREVKGEEIIE